MRAGYRAAGPCEDNPLYPPPPQEPRGSPSAHAVPKLGSVLRWGLPAVSSSLGLGLPRAEAASPLSVPRVPISPSLSPLICFLPLPSRPPALSLSRRVRRPGSRDPRAPLLAPPCPRVSLLTGCVRAPVSPPLARPRAPPLPGTAGRGGSGRGRAGGIAGPLPTLPAPWAERWLGRGAGGGPAGWAAR